MNVGMLLATVVCSLVTGTQVERLNLDGDKRNVICLGVFGTLTAIGTVRLIFSLSNGQ